MKLLIVPYHDDLAEQWDNFCGESLQASLLHTRRFLSYHEQRFSDRSVVICNADDESWLGVFPAALADRDDLTLIVSHPGATFGGVVHQGRLTGELMLAALQAIADYYRQLGVKCLRYKAVPYIYQGRPAQDDLYALFRLNAERVRCDLSCTINLHHPPTWQLQRRRALKKATSRALEIQTQSDNLPEFWQVLQHNLADKHATQPVHSLSEMGRLFERFPQQIKLISAHDQGRLLAGTILFNNTVCHHAQYIACSESGRQVGALEAVFNYALQQARNTGIDWFDFGICNEQQGRYLNQGLYAFKSGFGGGGVIYEFFDWALV